MTSARRVARRGGTIAFARRDRGEGPLVALCHATGFCKDVWLPVLDELASLADGWGAVAIDQRHHGSSEGFGADFDWWHVADDLLAVVADRRPVIGVGHSGGGAAVAMAELRRPGTFAAALLIEPIIFPPPFGVAATHPLAEGARRRRTRFGSRAEAVDAYRGRGPFARWDERVLRAYVEGGFGDDAGGVVLRCAPEAEAQYFLHAGAHGAWDRLGELALPVTIIAGEHSDTHRPELLAGLAARIPRCSVEVVAGASHFLPMEQPALIAERIAGAIAAVGV